MAINRFTSIATLVCIVFGIGGAEADSPSARDIARMQDRAFEATTQFWASSVTTVSKNAVIRGLGYAWASYGQPDYVHRELAYWWGYDSGLSPAEVTGSRTMTETLQAAYFTFFSFTDEYEPLSITGPGGLLDSLGDIAETRQGALDREAGLAPNPPSNRN